LQTQCFTLKSHTSTLHSGHQDLKDHALFTTISQYLNAKIKRKSDSSKLFVQKVRFATGIEGGLGDPCLALKNVESKTTFKDG
jgi:hypothetical protein